MYRLRYFSLYCRHARMSVEGWERIIYLLSLMSLSLYLVIHLYANLNIVQYYYSANFLYIPRSSITKSYFAHLILPPRDTSFNCWSFFFFVFIFFPSLIFIVVRWENLIIEHGINISFSTHPLFLYPLFSSLWMPRHRVDWPIEGFMPYAGTRDGLH